jgi:glycosyltransferase involved in cell wall biosynthesis
MWERGVDTALFRPRDKSFLCDRRPVFLYAGRVAVEKNIDAFMTIDVPGTKYVVGDGPDLERLKSEYPEVRFVGLKQGDELAQYMAAADVFVFPSRTDTFGIVMLEAMACGVPVAAYPVTGPIDVVQQGITGILSENLAAAALAALQLEGQKAREYALHRTWERAAKQFFCNLAINAAVAEPATTLTGNPAMVSG